MNTLELSNHLVSMKDNMERFAFRLTFNREDAQDLLQETYLRALSGMNYVAEFTNLTAWAFTIMKNIFINNYRKSVRERIFLYQADVRFLPGCNEMVFSNFRPDSQFYFKEIRNSIDSLTDEFKIPFKMHIDGYKYKEIAEELNLKIGTVKSRVFFARKKLMESLSDYQYDNI